MSVNGSEPGIEPSWPIDIVKDLDRFVVGQNKAKEYLAKALRDRWRRMQVPEPMRSEIEPKNVLMIGPTGVGKTEIARRLARMTNSPFIKVEATKFTEVGYMGRDVEQIVRDLLDSTIAKRKMEMRKKIAQSKGTTIAEERLLNILVGANATPETRHEYLKRLREREFDNKKIKVQVIEPIEVQGPQIPEIFGKLMNRRTKEMTVAEAMRFFQSEELTRELDDEGLVQAAIEEVEQSGIVFLDEIDKICESSNFQQKSSVSREGVQRDLLPLIEGTEVSTKYGFVKTHHIWFICAGAFQLTKPDDMIAELIGRLHVRIQMQSLTKADFEAILSTKEANLVQQYVALMSVDGIQVEFTPAGISAVAEWAVDENRNQEDVGARRLQGIMSILLHDVGYDVAKYRSQRVVVDEEFVAKFRGQQGHKPGSFVVL
jgi:ATP-dependent HslUV protease ATP-binding subunit HslU